MIQDPTVIQLCFIVLAPQYEIERVHVSLVQELESGQVTFARLISLRCLPSEQML